MPQDHATPGARHGLLRNFTSVLGANTVYRISQWILVVFIARWGSAHDVGQFALAQALAAPVFLTVGLNLRAARATDVEDHWRPGTYHRLRHLVNVLALMVTMALGAVVSPTAGFLTVLGCLALSKASEASSQLTYGLAQRVERLDVMAHSLLARSLLGTAAFAWTFYLERNLALACGMMALSWGLITLVHDLPRERHLLRRHPPASRSDHGTWQSLAKEALPLGMTAGISSLTLNLPRYTVHAFMGSVALGLFASLAYLGQTVQMITGSLSDSLIGRLARSAQAGNQRQFVRTLLMLSGFSLAVSLVVVAGGALLGAPVIRLLLGPEYVNQPVLIALLTGSLFVTMQRVIGRGLQGGRRFKDIMLMDACTCVFTAIACVAAVPQWGLFGAAVASGAGWALGSLVGLVRLHSMVRAMQPIDTATA